MSNSDDVPTRRSLKSTDPRLNRFPLSARENLRDQLHSIRLQLEVLGLVEAEKDVRAAILAACAGLQIPNHLSVRQMMDLGEDDQANEFH